ncbi:imelysin family protein [Sulfitobacter aestuarii]|uniref:Imelysin family protein n=1 Tax=Sulfitobacter aestuarii TaxID=2161676 RepID=A0ABW5U060_9RHOB
MRHVAKLLAAALLLTGPARADVSTLIDRQILPGYAAFAEETHVLAQTAVADCSRRSLRPSWNATFDAWLRVSHLNFGPVAEQGRSVIVAFWPDSRGATPATLARLIADADPIIESAAGTAQISVAARGLFALEYLLYDPRFTEGGQYTCDLIRALTSDLADVAEHIDTAWQKEFAETLRSAGAAGNSTYLTPREAQQALFTALVTGLEFNADQRLGRPMGSFERPRPKRAEAWRSARSLRNVTLSLAALRDLAAGLLDAPTPATDAAFERAIRLVAALEDPTFAEVATPQGRVRVEALQQAIHGARDAVLEEIGPELGVSAGFNAADGD